MNSIVIVLQQSAIQVQNLKYRKNVIILKPFFLENHLSRIASSLYPILYIINIDHDNPVLILYPLTVVLLRPLNKLVVLKRISFNSEMTRDMYNISHTILCV